MTSVVGIDIGGTHSRGRLVTDGRIVAEATASGASAAASGPQAAAAAVRELLSKLPLDRSRSLAAVCAGAAGTMGGASTAWLERELGPLTGGGPVVVVNDAALTLAAAGLDEGVGVICGTGSVAWGQFAGRRARAGGWGYLLGDEASGYWLVRRALQLLLERRDLGRSLGPLAADLLAAAGVEELGGLWRGFYEQPRPRPWARLAPAVTGSDDPAVEDLLAEAAGAVERMVSTVVQRLEGPEDLPIVLGGGVLGDARVQAAVTAALSRSRPRSPVRRLREPPVAGAVWLAQRAADPSASPPGGAEAQGAEPRGKGTGPPVE